MAAVTNSLGPAYRATLMASATVTADGTAAAVTGLGWARQALIELKLTDAKAAAGDTLDVYIDTSFDNGSTWVNAAHFTQILGNGADALQFAAELNQAGDPGTDVVALTSDCAAAKFRPTLLGDQLRVRYVVVDGGAHGQSFTFSVVALLKS